MSQLILGVPSKGRLEENASSVFSKAGIALKRAGARGYRGRVLGIADIEVQYISASEIAARLADGSVHFGITGEDLLREEIVDMDSVIQLVLPLGFGRADVVVAIPEAWADVTHMSDLAEVAADYRARHGKRLRVATKYTQLCSDFFARHGVSDYVIVQSFGATEAAPNSGAAEAIVDITSTGATLVANQLRVPEDGVMLKSEANLAASLRADWSDTPRAAAKQLLSRLAAYRTAGTTRQVQFLAEPEARSSLTPRSLSDYQEAESRFGARHLADSQHLGLENGSERFFVPEQNLQAMIDLWMRRFGFAQALVSQPDFIFENRNPLYERLAGALL
ncbi:ATP phosphoribosyltransferase [Alphaproteobacteria bacterium]|nr:ATP phosphoribosyltransferase [Alphaproteobacteria bacterium]